MMYEPVQCIRGGFQTGRCRQVSGCGKFRFVKRLEVDNKCDVCMAVSSFEGLGDGGRKPRDDGTGSVLEYHSYTRPFNLVCLAIIIQFWVR